MAAKRRVKDDRREARLRPLVSYLLAVHFERRRVPGSREYLDRGSLHRFRLSPH